MTDQLAGLVVAVGNCDRGDDAAGPAVARAVRGLGLPGVEVHELEDPLGLIDLWQQAALWQQAGLGQQVAGSPVTVVVDAMSGGGRPGDVRLLEVGGAPPAEAVGAGRRGRGTHAFGVLGAVELARALGILPPRVVLVGIEVEHLRHGEAMSPAVAGAVPVAVERVRDALLPLDAAGRFPAVERSRA